MRFTLHVQIKIYSNHRICELTVCETTCFKQVFLFYIIIIHYFVCHKPYSINKSIALRLCNALIYINYCIILVVMKSMPQSQSC